VPLALKALYDEDVLEEELIVAWYDKPTAGKVLNVSAASAKAVRDSAEPFVEWLKNAESDEETDEDE
jgi:translation initiation factor 5